MHRGIQCYQKSFYEDIILQQRCYRPVVPTGRPPYYRPVVPTGRPPYPQAIRIHRPSVSTGRPPYHRPPVHTGRPPYHRPPARGGPTIYVSFLKHRNAPYIVGPPLAGGL